MKYSGYTFIMTHRRRWRAVHRRECDIRQRMHQHRADGGFKFCFRYGIDTLVVVESHAIR
jgi:hypothetical protein